MAFGSLGNGGGELGHDGADDAGADVIGLEARLAEQRADEEAHLVDGAFRVGRDAPVLEELIALEEAHDDLGVADVEDEDHAWVPVLVGAMRTVAEAMRAVRPSCSRTRAPSALTPLASPRG
jgi:hypothetical protein